MSRLLSAANSYAANNRGSYALWIGTATRDTFVDSYLKIDGDDFSDPDGRPYLLTASTAEQVNHKVIIVNLGGYQCGDNGSMVYTGNINEIAFRIRLEGGGIYCVDN